MRNIFKNRFVFWPASFIAILIVLSLVIFNADKSFSTDNTNLCAGGSILLSGPTTTETPTIVLPALAEFKIAVPAATSPTEIKLFAKDSHTSTQTLLGRALPQGGTANSNGDWVFIWPTTLWTRSATDAGLISVTAKVTNSQTSTPCVISSSASYYIQYNTTPTPLNVTVTPTSITTYVGSSNTQELVASPSSPTSSIATENIKNYSVIEWATDNNNIGGISNDTNNFLSNANIIFNAGSRAGTNTIKVHYIYGGAVSNTVSIPITVKPLENTTTTPPSTSADDSTSTKKSDTPNAVSTTTPVTTSDLTTSNQVTSSQLQISTATQTCIEEGLGSTTRYKAINSGSVRPTTDELNKINNCFATSKYILPASFSPVDPIRVDKLSTDDNVVVNNLENVNKTTTTGTKETLKITGKAAPKSKVFVYIYSDPLIITTTADDNGNWQYTIEDPLVPGKHEVYAVVDKGDGTYKRSDPLAFLISTASATAVNPNGLSLKLSEPPVKTPTQLQGSLILYVTGSVLAIVTALIILFLVLRSHNKHKLAVSKITATNPDCTYCNPSTTEATTLAAPAIANPIVEPMSNNDLSDSSDNNLGPKSPELLEQPEQQELLEEPEQPELLEASDQIEPTEQPQQTENQNNSNEQKDTTDSPYESQ